MSGKIAKIIKPILWTLAGFAGFVVILLTTAQIILSGEVLPSLINKYYPKLIDGKLEMSTASLSVFKHFPAVYLELGDVAITYPHERFDSLERSGCRNWLLAAGKYRPSADSTEVAADTLASFTQLKAAVNLLSLMRGVINVKDVELIRPRVYIHVYNDGSSNLGIFKVTATEEESTDSTLFDLSSLVVRRLFIGSDPCIVLTSQVDTIFTLMHLRQCSITGWQNMGQLDRGRCKLRMDSLLVAGSNKSDTLVFGLDSLYLNKRQGDISLMAEAKAFYATHQYGRLKIPIRVDGEIELENPDEGKWNIGLHPLSVDVTSARVDADMDLCLDDSISLKGVVELPGLKVQEFVDEYASHLIPELSKLHTDACLTAKVDVDGSYHPDTGELPGFSIDMELPRCNFTHDDYPMAKPVMEMKASAAASQGGPVDASLSCLHLSLLGMNADVKGSVSDLLGEDPFITAKASFNAGLDTLNTVIGRQLGFDAKGSLKATADGSLKFSNLNLFNLNGARIKAEINADDVDVRSVDDSLRIFCDNLDVNMGVMQSKLKKSKSSAFTVLGATVKTDSVFFLSKGAAQIKGKNIMAFAQTSPESVKINDSTSYYPILAKLELGSVYMEGVDSLSIRVKESKSKLSVIPSRQSMSAPMVKLDSRNDRVRVKFGPNRFFVRNLNLSTKAKLVGNLKAKARKAFMDSVYRSYPDLPKDSVNAIMRSKYRERIRQMQFSDDDFKDKDVQIDLGATANKYFHEWEFDGNLGIGKFTMLTPAFPLKTSIHNFSCSVNNDMVSLDSLRLVSGDSDMDARGKIYNIKKAMRRRGDIKVDATVRTDSLSLSQLLYAYAQGVKNMEEMSQLANVDDATLEKAIYSEPVDTTVDVLVVIPRNVDANISLRGKGMTYSDVNINRFDADLKMKDHCLQLTDLTADSSVGKVNAEAFYSTKSKSDIYAGFDINLSEISAEGVIDLIPQIDTLLPLLKSFGGQLDLNLSATTQLDTMMNVMGNTIDGVFRIAGKDLHFQDNKKATKIFKKLLFRHPERATIDTMTVEGTVKDGRLEVFPFILKIDRWAIALAGVQDVDKSFSYHVSMLKTPFLIKFGANIYGDDFDDVNIKLGKAKYTNKNIPSFSTEIDHTRINLLSSIRNIFNKGVEKAVRENGEQKSLENARKEKDYSHSVALDKLEALPGKDMKQLDSLSAEPEKAPTDSLQTTPAVK